VPVVREESHAMTHSKLIRRQLTVELENGLHMVPCSAIAKAVREFGGPVRILRGDLVIDASSVFDLLGLGAQRGTVLILEADGDGAESLLDRLEQVFLREPEGRK
jgi:phosphotransferase system HPr (HPr) family protein